MDAKDILGLPKTPISISGSHDKKSRPHKESQRKPDGISRELYALTGGLAPLIPSIDVNQLKRKTQSQNEKVAWQWLPFTNSARKDNLQLYHWVRVVNSVPPTGDYSFAKFNKSVDLNKYSDIEYDKYLQDPMWTKEETDQLFDLCERFDLRFIVIADRFPTPRSVEELKDRYYKVSRAVFIARAPTHADVAAHPLVKEPYNITQETERRRTLSMILSQTKQQERRDAEVIAEAKRISEVRKAEKQAKELEVVIMSTDQEGVDKGIEANDAVIEAPNSQIPCTSVGTSEAEIAATLVSLCALRVYLRTYGLNQMVQAVNSSAGLRTIKHVEQTLQDLAINLKPKVPTKAVCAEHIELRKEILTLLNLQKQLQHKEAEGPSYEEGSYSESPDTPPKRSQRGMDNDRSFTPDSFNSRGDRMGKRDQKRKGTTPSSPAQSKRPRKLKTDG